MHVAARYRDSLFIHGGAEAADDALDVLKMQLLVAANGLGHWRVGLFLLDHRAGGYLLEGAHDAHRVHVVSGGLELIDERGELISAQARGGVGSNARDKVRGHRVGSALIQICNLRGAIATQLVAGAIQNDHLPVQAIKGA